MIKYWKLSPPCAEDVLPVENHVPPVPQKIFPMIGSVETPAHDLVPKKIKHGKRLQKLQVLVVVSEGTNRELLLLMHGE